jgi:MFS family permease
MSEVLQPLKRPSATVVQASLVLGQTFFGLGSVIAALGLPACNPFAFALYREIAAGTILLGASIWQMNQSADTSASTALSSPVQDWQRFTLLGLAIFGNQAGVIAGIKLAGAVAAAVWQPSQPIMTAAISMAMGREALDRCRVAGVILSFLGCAAMVVLSTKGVTAATEKDGDALDGAAAGRITKELVGHALFFFNCLCTSLYIILSKRPLLVYSPLVVTAWSYNIAAVFMGLTAFVMSLSPSVMSFLCPDCTGIWNIPFGAIFALLYFIVFNSVGAYAILTWANQYATGTLVMG